MALELITMSTREIPSRGVEIAKAIREALRRGHVAEFEFVYPRTTHG